MTDKTLLVNLALQSFGSRTTVTAAELLNNGSNEAIQANLTFENTRDSLLRLAPWDCAMKTANLAYITSVPGTQQNSSSAQSLWQPGLPRPPWAFEYQYPVDCLRACWIIPASQTGFTGIPITTAITGNTPTTWLGAPIVFKVAVDEFFPVTAVALSDPFAGGTGYAVGDYVTLAYGATGSPPIGAPLVIRVLSLFSTSILTMEIVNQVAGSDPSIGGSYFNKQTGIIGQSSTTGSGSGATFALTFGPDRGKQRVILTNQEYATLVYVNQVTDPNVWDPMFQDAFVDALGADIVMGLNGDKGLANICIQRANDSIARARTADGNEGLTINDVIPDWLRVRGIGFDNQYLGPNAGFDWGGFLPMFS